MKKHFFFLFVMLNLVHYLPLQAQQNKIIDSLENALKQYNAHKLELGNNNNTLLDSSKVKMFDNLIREVIRTGQYLKADSLARQTLKLSESINFPKGTAWMYNHIGIINKEKGNYSEALSYYLKALKINQEINYKKGITNNFINIGIVYSHQGDDTRALEYLLKGLKLSETIKHKILIGVTLGNIANVYNAIGDYKKSLEYQLKALKLSKENGNNYGVNTSLIGIGVCYMNLKNYSKSLEYFQQGLQLAQDRGDKSIIAFALEDIGKISEKTNDYSKALEYYFKALKIDEELDEKNSLPDILSCIGHIYTLQKKYPQAEDYLNKSLKIAAEIKNLPQIEFTHKKLYELYEQEGNCTLAMLYYKKYIIERDSMYNEENTKKQTQIQMRYMFDKKQAADSIKAGEEKKVITVQLEQEQTKRYSLYGGLVLVLAFSGFMFNRFKVSQKQKKIIEFQKSLVDEKQKEIVDSINYAKRIQYTLLAQDDLLKKNLKDYFILFKPKDIVSGDFYWATFKEGAFYIAICDSTGHGVPGAFMSLLNTGFLSEAINEKGITEPNKVLDYVRNRLVENISKEEQQDGMDGTLVRFQVSGSKLKVDYASAHNAPVLICNSEQLGEPPKLIELPYDKMPIGKGEKQAAFTLHTIEAKTGDTLYFFTDGFADQFGGIKGKKFKYAKLKEALLANNDKAMAEQKNILEAAFNNWKGNLEQIDDVLIMGIKI